MIVRREQKQTTHVLFQDEWYPCTGPKYKVACLIVAVRFKEDIDCFSYHECEQINLVLTALLNCKHRVNHVHSFHPKLDLHHVRHTSVFSEMIKDNHDGVIDTFFQEMTGHPSRS